MIRVLFFGKVADLMGRRELDLEASAEGMTLFNLRAQIFDGDVAGDPVTAKVLMSVNRDVVRDDLRLKAGDEVAFFSPFSGG